MNPPVRRGSGSFPTNGLARGHRLELEPTQRGSSRARLSPGVPGLVPRLYRLEPPYCEALLVARAAIDYTAALFLRCRHSASATRVASARRGPCLASTLGHRFLATSVWFRFARGGTAFLAFAHCALWTRGRRLRLRES